MTTWENIKHFRNLLGLLRKAPGQLSGINSAMEKIKNCLFDNDMVMQKGSEKFSVRVFPNKRISINRRLPYGI